MYHPAKFYTKGLGGYMPLTMCFIVVDSPSSSWTGALIIVYIMTAFDLILQWLILIVTGALFINWAYKK